MSNLSQECIKAITVHEECYYQDYGENRNTKIRSTFMVGATEALTNPTIYQSAGLMTVEEADDFVEWKSRYLKSELKKCLQSNSVEQKGKIERLCGYTTTELLTIFRNQNK